MAGFVPECQSTKTNTDDPKVAGFGPESLAGFTPESVAGFAPERWQGLVRNTQALVKIALDNSSVNRIFYIVAFINHNIQSVTNLLKNKS